MQEGELGQFGLKTEDKKVKCPRRNGLKDGRRGKISFPHPSLGLWLRPLQQKRD
jgi:hypothetical protein